MKIDIYADAGYPGGLLSNLYPHKFVFGGLEIASMEGLLQAFKFKDRSKQIRLTALHGLEAKYADRAGDGWKATQFLYWDGVPYDRHGASYQRLLWDAYHALAVNMNFQTALLATGRATLTHRIGSDDPRYTILTTDEFTQRLVGVRSVLQRHVGEDEHELRNCR